ncbi:DUF805 domain-containing protein [Ancylobacter sp. Lp-2]|uniref:DUF805 domain-containing protein n=1 Tax=Ancylobacter sp. Lp-2 TaxID=2881339 RepID=UPI001E2CCC58|nr:DUF805 domain-containing protein [Ancylobacter sp. Lp-2]MCB4769372.1 DUF805 domain-containing protein [Ancylobacter sp. Lp-2]
MTFFQAVSSVLGKYATFHGRAPRSELWWFTLFGVLAPWIAGLLDLVLFHGVYFVQHGETQALSPLYSLAQLALLIPSFAVGARRFHDMNRTGWWQLLIFTGIGAFVVLVWFMFKGTEGPNRFGPDPLGQF